jgi:predicted membrane channel-forming protein YqfA (hemolysin III family)
MASFMLAAFKCLFCSSLWHLFAGCATKRYFLAFACVVCTFCPPIFEDTSLISLATRTTSASLGSLPRASTRSSTSCVFIAFGFL